MALAGAGFLEAKHGDLPDDDPRIMTVGFFLIAGGGMSLIGGILGLVGVLVSGRKKLYAGIGLGFNSCIILGVIALCIISALAQ